MCKICVEITLGKLTSKEAKRNMGELTVSWNPRSEKEMHVEHAEKVYKKIKDLEEKELQDEPEPFDGGFTD